MSILNKMIDGLGALINHTLNPPVGTEGTDPGEPEIAWVLLAAPIGNGKFPTRYVSNLPADGVAKMLRSAFEEPPKANTKQVGHA